ncbi:MAG: ribonuclease J [Clostridia bacterium]|nr:ribonuclease J [Clostridia bacterium]
MKNNNEKNKSLLGHKLRVMSLGGLQEIGKNMTVLEYGDDIIVIDAGMGFPDEDMLGVDLVIPDISYLIKNAHKIRGILITHGHEDHIGGVPYVLSQINVPIYGTRLALGIIEGKLDENPPPFEPELYTVEAGDVINLGVFKAEFIHVNHSIADACAISIKTPVGIVFHTGDFKLDVSPIDGKMMDITRIGEIGKAGVTLLLCESTNAERSGFTPSERTVGSSLERIFAQYENRRLIIATFSSNVHRVQQIINASANHNRKVAVLGRSMVNIIGAAAELGYMDLPDGVLIDVNDIKRYKPEDITLITTGSQGEPMSALYRIAFDEHDRVKINSNDVVVLSSSAIPGNEKLVGKIINALVKNGVKVVNDSTEDVHVSGHACRDEIKLMMALTKPKYFMPIHGEYRHLYANKDIAEFMGIKPDNIFISEIGKVLEIDRKGARFNGTVPAGKVLVDGSGVGDIGSVVLRDRKHLAEDGLVVVVATIDSVGKQIVSGPDIVSRGFVYVKESEELMRSARRIAEESLERAMKNSRGDWAYIKSVVRDDMAKFIFKETKRKPMILSVIMDI